MIIHGLPGDLQERITVAFARGVYAPAREPLDHILELKSAVSPEDTCPFILEYDIPVELRGYIRKKAIGSTAPLLDTGEIAYWEYDIDRWLKAIGIAMQSSEPSQFP